MFVLFVQEFHDSNKSRFFMNWITIDYFLEVLSTFRKLSDCVKKTQIQAYQMLKQWPKNI